MKIVDLFKVLIVFFVISILLNIVMIFETSDIQEKVNTLIEQNDSLSIKIDSLTKEVYLMNAYLYD